MTPHARRFSHFQASLKASSASAAAFSQASDAVDSSSSSSDPTKHDSSPHHQHDHHEFHEHEHQKPYRHSHYLPSSRSRKQKNHDGGAQVAEPASPQGDNGNAAAHADNELRRRQTTNSATLITEIVQTISVVQVIDGNGSIVTMQTLYSTPVTQVIDSSDGATVDSSDFTQTPAAETPAAKATGAAAATASPSSSSVETTSTKGTGTSETTRATEATGATQATGVASDLSSSSSSTSSETVTAGATQGTGAASSLSQQTSVAAQTAAANTGVTEPFTNATASGLTSTAATTAIPVPLTTGPSTTLLPVTYNSTAGHIYTNSTLPHTLFANTSRTSTTLSRHHTSSTFSSSLISSTTSSTFASKATDADGAGGAGGAPAGTAPAATSTSSSNNNDSTGTPTSVLVGSVIGGLAGVAVLLVVVMFLLKWKKKRDARGHKLLGDGDDMNAVLGGAIARSVKPGGGSGGPGGAAGAIGPSGGSGPNNGPGGGMSENRTAFLMPFASALAAGQKRLSRGTTGASTFASDASSSAAGGAGSTGGNTERGFYRVSGKKLPSVLQHGGDGYEDPRESMLSVNTSLYRDSRGFFGGAGGPATTPTSRYAVGSPMRPESGVPIFHSGPGKAVAMRMPLSRQGSFIHDDTASVRNLTPPPGIDPIGRSMASQDNSRGSGSRFTEDIL
ncbi:hypothetical protein SEUCBS140593_005069 [Sporothrix eucalyptigena]|uniref:Uncharacterized protein n=1 Tax=Sporothrix eucalyptigena TaxID=1812306 RepID=A0ABP0BTW2_9PEZI